MKKEQIKDLNNILQNISQTEAQLLIKHNKHLSKDLKNLIKYNKILLNMQKNKEAD